MKIKHLEANIRKRAKAMAKKKGTRKLAGKTLKQLNIAYVRAATTLCVRAEELIENPDDAEALHQYRISLRVARSLMKFGRPYIRKEHYRKLSGTLKELQDPTSSVRELDMLVKQLEELDANDKPPIVVPTGYRSATAAGVAAQQAARERDDNAVIKKCKEVQEQTRADFLRQFRAKKTRKKIVAAAKALGGMDWRGSVKKEGISKRELIKRVSAEQAYCMQGLASVDPKDVQTVHELRKRAKALRYVTRELSECLPKEYSQTSAEMKGIQDELGDMLDARVNAALLDEICGEDARAEIEAFEKRAEQIAENVSTHRA